MNKNIYRIEKRIESTDIDFNLDTKLSSIFLFFQEVASKHADNIGIGKKATTDKGLHWVITRFNVDVVRLPKYGEDVYIETYPGDNNKLFFYRYFMIKDRKNNILLRASSIWLVLNPITGMIVKNPFEGINIPVHHEADELPLPDKVDITEGELIYKDIIRYSDIDLNKHLNNTRYIELIQNAFDLDFYSDYKIKNITINYLAELKSLDEVNIYKAGDNPYIIVGKKNDKVHFVAHAEYQKN